MTKKNWKIILGAVGLSLLISGVSVYAENLYIPEISTLPGPSVEQQEAGIRSVLVDRALPRLIVTLLGFVTIAALLFLVISGVRYATAYGNDENVEKAKNQMIYSVAGLIIAMLAFTIVSIVINLNLGNQAQTTTTSGGNAATVETSE